MDDMLAGADTIADAELIITELIISYAITAVKIVRT